MDAFEAIKATFFQECDELLADLEQKLMLLEQGQTDLETINAVFRAVHSVKGGAGAFGLDDLVRFAHVFETLMDELRAGRKPCDPVTIKTLLRASDVLADHVQAAQGLAAPVDQARSAALVAEMEQLTHGGAAPVPAADEDDDFGFTPMAFDMPLDAPPSTEPATGWRIVFRPHGRMYASANEAALLLRELARLGPTVVSVDEGELPTLEALVVEEGWLTWTVELNAAVDEAAQVFETFNLDLMYALPGQTLADLDADLTQALALAPPHLSIYHLTLEPNTYFHRYPPKLPDDETAADMQQAVEAKLAAAGYRHYETSAFAQPGKQSRHNMNYWAFGDYLGIGAGAHGKLSFPDRIERQGRARHPAEYAKKVLGGDALVESAGGHALRRLRERVDRPQRATGEEPRAAADQQQADDHGPRAAQWPGRHGGHGEGHQPRHRHARSSGGVDGSGRRARRSRRACRAAR